MAKDEHVDPIERLAVRIVNWATASHVLVAIFTIIVVWVVAGPVTHWSGEWQSTMEIPVTIITFMLVFFILRAQNKDTRAIQLKLNEIIAALDGANNELIDIENKSEHELAAVHERYETVAANIDKLDGPVTGSIIVTEKAEAIALVVEAELAAVAALEEATEVLEKTVDQLEEANAQGGGGRPGAAGHAAG